ncbi:DnaJ-domain-containing protein [Hypoxylon sp. FL1857]|nr:DnaJ-domain-containing protein [Hypoxylon sp. FL1857]
MARPNFPKHDLYKVLGVESTASLEDIKRAYRELCKKVHPDKAAGGNNQENTERFQRVQEAWEILRDEVLRREYDSYRASGARDSHRDNKDADSGRRRKARKEREERPGSSRSERPGSRDSAYNDAGDTYGSKPNRQRKPYYEKWGGTYDDEPYEGHQDDEYHPGGPPPFSGFHGPYTSRRPAPGPAPGPQYEPYEERYMPEDPRGPPHAVKLEDRIITMRLWVDMRQASRELDSLQVDIKTFKSTFIPHPFTDDCRWCTLLDGVSAAFDSLEDLYDVLHMRLKDVEVAHPMSRVTAHNLPELLGILQAHITRMKYAATAVLVILDQLSYFPPSVAERWLLDDLELRLRTMTKARWVPTDL